MGIALASTFPFRSKPCYLTITTLSNYEIMKVLCRLIMLAFLLVSFTYVSSFGNDKHSSSSITGHEQSVPSASDSVNLDQLLSLFFRDLTNEGLVKRESRRSVFLSNEIEENLAGAQSLADYNIDLIALHDSEKQSSVLDGTVDFILTFNFQAASRFIDRTLKTGGVVTVLLNDSPSAAFCKPPNYKIAYMRRFDLIAVAMWKTSVAGTKLHDQRKLLSGHPSEAKKAALLKLEDVLLEPPRSASKKSRRYLKRTRYLPDLMEDSLESYPRRVFIDVGSPEKDGGSKSDWFSTNYPTRNKDFEMYKIETVTGDSSGSEVPRIGMSDWVRKNVKEEEYVVMKAEAEVVEEMVSSKAIMLVDELFLVCQPQLGKRGESKSRRAYWECLALYGKLRDEGVAVHQWWG